MPNTRIDGRTKQWVIANTIDEKTIYGLIVSNKKDIQINRLIKIRHYIPISHNDKKLCLKLCDSVNCQFYDDNTKQCIIEVQKRKCNMIIGRTKKQSNNIITITNFFSIRNCLFK